MEHNEGTTRIGRREAVKKAAVAGAVAWSAPMILSSKVSAAGGTCLECDTFYFAKRNFSGGSFSACKTDPGGQCKNAGILPVPQFTIDACPFLDFSYNPSTRMITVSIKPGQLLGSGGIQKVWTGGAGQTVCDLRGHYEPCTRSVSFSDSQSNGGGVSNINVLLCA